QFRDIRHAMTFAMQILMYAAPVVWPVSKIPGHLRLWYGLYPMAGVIEGFRVSLLNTAGAETGGTPAKPVIEGVRASFLHPNPMPWDLIGMGAITATVAFLIGALYFRRTERFFADVA